MTPEHHTTQGLTKVRAAALPDAPAILALERGCSTAAHWNEQHYLEAVAGSGQERLLLVAESQAKPYSVVGFLVARHVVREWELENIVVAADARRTGIGQRLMDTFLTLAGESSGSSVFLEVRESNGVARSFYAKTGFRESGRRKLYYVNPPEDAILYRMP